MDAINIPTIGFDLNAVAISTSIILTILGVVFIPIIKWIHDVQSKTVEVEKKGAETYTTKHETNDLLDALETRWNHQAARFERRLDDLYRIHMPTGGCPAVRPEQENP